MSKEKELITHPHLILCEGLDAKLFLCYYLNSAALSDVSQFSSDIQVMDFGGNENLSNYLAIVRNTDGFEQAKSVLIVRDSESDPTAAIQQVQSALARYNFPVPAAPHTWETGDIQVGFTLFPTCDNAPTSGALEDLCYSILTEPNVDPLLHEVDAFLSTLETEHGRTFPRKFKNKLHTYLASNDAYVSLKIGEAAKAGAFDWTSPKLAPLKDFILEVL